MALEILPKLGHDNREARSALIRMLSVAHDLRIADGGSPRSTASDATCSIC